MKRRLLVTSTELMMVQFLAPHIKYLSTQGFDIDIACSEVGGRFEEVKRELAPYVNQIFKLSLVRSPFSLKNWTGYKDLTRLFKNNNYDLVWTNEPVMSVATRLAARNARKKGTKVMYMSHGFHFFKKAPMINWILFYPIERFVAGYTDKIVCINKEDFDRAQKFNVNEVAYIHGIGMDTSRLTKSVEKRTDIRKELNLKNDDFLILSIGELNKNKNQKTIIKALSTLDNSKIHYILCGKGTQLQDLEKLTSELGLDNQVHFLGYRRDVVDICTGVDLFAMPSLREGLGLAALEAMYCGLPLVTSNLRGFEDYNKAGRNGFLCSPTDYEDFATKIGELYTNKELADAMSNNNLKDVTPFILDNSLSEVKAIFDNL